MTLTKILLAIAILAGVVWLAMPPVFCDGPNARVDIARAAIGRNGPIAKAFESYRHDSGHYPDSALGLGALFKAPPGVALSEYRGPYLEGSIEDLTDPWGHPCVYRAPGTFNKDGFDLYSSGPDGIDNGGRDDGDDIKNWTK